MAPANKTLSLFRTREKEGKKLFWPNFVFKQYTYPPHHLRCIMVYGVSHGVSSRHAETCGYYQSLVTTKSKRKETVLEGGFFVECGLGSC